MKKEKTTAKTTEPVVVNTAGPVAVKAAEPKKAGRFAALGLGLTLLFGAMFAGILMTNARNQDYQNRLDNVYQRSFYEYSEAVSNIELNLSKMMVSSSASSVSELAAQTYRHAEVAQLMLTNLPFPGDEVAETSKFLNQIGDWCLSYSRAVQVNRSTESYKDQIEDLYVTAASLNTELKDGEAGYRDGGFKRMANLKPFRAEVPAKEGKEEETVRRSVEYPEMIYDGPFSDSRKNRSYKAFESSGVLPEPEVASRVKEKLPFEIKKLELKGQSECKARCYEYEADTPLGTAYISASEYGGQILNFNLYKSVTETKVSEENAKFKAKEYAGVFGFEAEPVWYNHSDGVALVTLAPVKDDTVYYTDLVKVKVALDDGGLLGVEAKSYCQNNCERVLRASMKADAAKALVPKDFTVNDCRKAVVPTKDGGEELCYEISGEFKGLDYLIYLSAANGREVNVLRVVDSPSGPVTY